MKKVHTQNPANKTKNYRPLCFTFDLRLWFQPKNSPYQPSATFSSLCSSPDPCSMCSVKQKYGQMCKYAQYPPFGSSAFFLCLYFSLLLSPEFSPFFVFSRFGRFLFSAFTTLLRGFGLRCGTFVCPTTPTSLAAHFQPTKNKVELHLI